jgi:hypothetical protein
MGIYNFICGPWSYDAFPKWPARSFGLATPGLKRRVMEKVMNGELEMMRNEAVVV